MENQVYHIQRLLVNELDNCKGKRNEYTEGHIKKIQDIYKQEDIEVKIQESSKEKQQIQDEKVLLYKPYKVNSPKPKTPEPIFIQDELDNLDKYMKYMQAPVKMMQLYPLLHYKSLKPQEEWDEQYWKEIAITFLEQKYDADIMRKGFLIEVYIGSPPYKPYFIALTLWGQIIVGPTKKLVTTHMIKDLSLLD